MFELLLLIGVVYWIGTDFGDKAGEIALAVLIVFLVVMFVSIGRKTDRAVGNWVDYWSKGGPEQKQRNRLY